MGASDYGIIPARFNRHGGSLHSSNEIPTWLPCVRRAEYEPGYRVYNVVY